MYLLKVGLIPLTRCTSPIKQQTMMSNLISPSLKTTMVKATSFLVVLPVNLRGRLPTMIRYSEKGSITPQILTNIIGTMMKLEYSKSTEKMEPHPFYWLMDINCGSIQLS